MEEEPKRQGSWTRYWRQGALHTLHGSLSEQLGGSISAFWSGQFERLCPEHRVLDIGTGNGALPALIHHQLGDAMPRVDAADLADIHPGWLASTPPRCREAIAFHPRTRAEALPFPDGRYELVLSQYGFEYADRPPAAAEAARVMAPGGRIALLMHSTDSRLSDVAGLELGHADWLARTGGCLDAAKSIYPFVAQARTAEGRATLATLPAANHARERLNQAMHSLDSRATASQAPDLLLEAREFIVRQMQQINASGDVASAEARHESYRHALADAVLRYQELLEHALDDAAVKELTNLLRNAGLVDIRVQRLRQGAAVMGWTLTAVRN